MRISAPFGSGCIGTEPVTITVEDCDNPDAITWAVIYKPDGAEDPVINPLGGGKFEVTAAVKGSYVIEAECCG